MILAGVIPQPVLAAGPIAVALGTILFTLGASWSTRLDIGSSHAGVVSATMNTVGQIGSVLSPLMVTFLLKRFGDWNLPLFVMGELFLVGAACWGLVNPHNRIFD